MDFGDIIKSLREELGLSREEFCKKINISYSALSKYETNSRFPDKEVIGKIADFFNVSVDYLLGRTNKRNLDTNQEKPKLDESIKTIAAHRINLHEDLPDDAIEKINEYIKMVEMMYKNKK